MSTRRMTANALAFDEWIRGDFVALNTGLEELYFRLRDRNDIAAAGNDLKERLLAGGRHHIMQLLAEGNTDEGFERGFELLGSVGLYMGACRRHELTVPDRETSSPLREASALALQLGASLGVAPRFATSHLATHNAARAGRYRSFTSLPDELLFIEYNTRGILAYKRAADALVRILPLGISHPVAWDLLRVALDALNDVARFNDELFARLDTERFFYSVRPYYRPYRVGNAVYRGANAGDFAGINEIDLLLGLCRADHAYYAQLLVDKFMYMMPEDQGRLRDCMRQVSLMDAALALLDEGHCPDTLRRNVAMLLEVCVAHGHAAAQHHDQLVQRFIAQPSTGLPAQALTHITASGPPLDVLLAALERLRDLRLAADRDDLPTRHRDIARLRAWLV